MPRYETPGAGPKATATRFGAMKFANATEAADKLNDEVALTPKNLTTAGLVQYADVTLTAVQVKALATTQIELVAAQGAGTLIRFLGAVLKIDYGSEVFAEPSAPDELQIKYTNAAGVGVSNQVDATGFVTASADTYTNANPIVDAIVAASAAENAALVLDNTGANYTGNASNDSTITVRTYYVVQSL